MKEKENLEKIKTESMLTESCDKSNDEKSEVSGNVKGSIDVAEGEAVDIDVEVSNQDVGEVVAAQDVVVGDSAGLVGDRVDNESVDEFVGDGLPVAVDDDDTSGVLVYSQEDVDKLIAEAYLRGKNEAVERRIRQDSSLRNAKRNRDYVGLERYMVGRPSVWQDVNQ